MLVKFFQLSSSHQIIINCAAYQIESLFSLCIFLNQYSFAGSTPWKINQEVLDLVIKVFMNQSNHESILNDLSISRNPELLEEPTMDESIKHEGNLSGAIDNKTGT